MKTVSYLALAGLLGVASAIPQPWSYNTTSKKWESTNDWAVGGNFIPSTAVNQLEMWQLSTWDADTIERELGFAASLGMNAMRVFLHDLMWSDSPERFLKTADRFLDIAQKHDIGILFVIFDSCWTAYPMLGPQPEPTPYVHNSQWVQSPGVDIVNSEEDFLLLESYVTGVLTHFKDDHRVIGWDLWNEPDNSGYTPDHIASLLAHVFDWARAVSPSQPLTSCLWKGGRWGNFEQLSSLEKLCVTESDVISFHHYGDVEDLSAWTESLLGYDKPVMCTEYMARGQNSTFNPNLGYFKEEHISAFSWGVVSGKTQTIYPWDSSETPNPYAGQDDPQPWFHDIFRSDGTARYPEEADYIKSLTGVSTV